MFGEGSLANMSRQDLAMFLLSFMQMQAQLLRSGADSDNSFIGGLMDQANAPGIPKGTREREHFLARMDTDPLGIVREWYRDARAEVGAFEGEIFNARIYGLATLKEKLAAHTTLWRCWNLLVAIEMKFAQGAPDRARAQTVQGLKALHTAISADGRWAEAWSYAMLPDLTESEGGISVAERATTGRWIREKAALEEALKKASEDPSPDGAANKRKKKGA